MNIVDKQLDSYNEKDLETFITCFTDDIEAYMFGTNKLLTKGKEELQKAMSDNFKSDKKSRTLVLSRIYQGNLLVECEKIIDHNEEKAFSTLVIYEITNNLISKIWFGGRSTD